MAATAEQMAADGLVMETLITPEGRADPHPRYHRLRETAPVHKSSLGPLWFVTRYDDCNFLLRDNRFGKGDPADDRRALFTPGVRPRPPSVMATSMLFVNPPSHTRLRGLVVRGFTPKRVQEMRGSIESAAGRIMDALAAEREVDVMKALAFRLPVDVIGELIGVPAADREQFRPIVGDVAASLEIGVTEEQIDQAEAAMAVMEGYFRELIEKRRSEPSDDLTSALIAARDGEDALTEDELVATLILLFAAGFETTTNLIGNGLLALLRHPDQLARLRAEPELIPSAVEEILRFESPVQVDARVAFEPVEIDGHLIEEGDFVIAFLGAANRDPAQFPDPDTFDVGRDPNYPLSFAAGIHHCLGANLARLEGRVVLESLLSRFSNWELLDDEPQWRNRLILRGLERLPVRFTP